MYLVDLPYATTQQFLDDFSLQSLDQLPSLAEIRSMEALEPQIPLDTDASRSVSDVEQPEKSFSHMVDALRESEQTGKNG